MAGGTSSDGCAGEFPVRLQEKRRVRVIGGHGDGLDLGDTEPALCQRYMAKAAIRVDLV
jgi:hypothetical protein